MVVLLRLNEKCVHLALWGINEGAIRAFGNMSKLGK